MRCAVAVTVFVLSLAILCGPAARGQAGYVPAGGELLTNTSFDKDTSGWTLSSRVRRVEGQGRSGGACLFGDGRGIRRRSIRAEQTVRLKRGAVYRLTFWTRSIDRSCISANLARAGRKVRILGRMNETPKRWTPNTYLLAAEEAGEYAVRIMLPNTWQPNAGRVWLDDVSLVELGRCEPEDIGSGLYDDYPCAAADAKGNVWMACLAFDPKAQAERIVLRRHDGKAWSAPRTIRSAKEMFAPAIAVTDSGQWVAWAQRVEGNWDVFARRVGPAMGKPIRVTTSAAVDRNVSIAITAGGDVWVTWQSDRNGANDILAAVVNHGPVKPVAISTYAGSDYNPSAVAVGNTVYVAWDSFRNGSYDVFMKAIDAGRPGELMQITRDPTTENRPHLTADAAGRVWIAYNVGTLWRGHYGRRNWKFFGLRCYERGKLYRPAGEAPRVWDIRDAGEELPALTVSGAGGLRIVTAAAQANLRCWTLAGRDLAGGNWSGPKLVSGAAYASCRRPVLLGRPDGGAWLIWNRTDRIASPVRRSNRLGRSTICATVLPVIEPERRRPPRLVEVALEPPAVAKIARPRRRSIEHGGKTLDAYWGDLHAHSNISICVNHLDALPDSLYACARDNAALDFMALTDHGGHMNDPDFHTVRKLARANNQPGRFLAFLAQEWSSAGAGGYGHKNIIYAHDHADRYFNPHAASIQKPPHGHANPRQLWDALSDQDALTIPHQLADAQHKAYTDWTFMDKWMQPVAEILQNRGSYEFKTAPLASRKFAEGHSLHDAWAAGHVLGVIASPDHGGGRGRAVVFAEKLTRRAVHDALRHRRCYGTTGARIHLDFRVNGRLMGEEITVGAADAPRRITVLAEHPCLETLVLYRSNKEILRRPITDGRIELTFTDEAKLPTGQAAWYYVRVEGRNPQTRRLELAWSSPIWVTAAPAGKARTD